MTQSDTRSRNSKIIVLFILVVLTAGLLATFQIIGIKNKEDSIAGRNFDGSESQLSQVHSRYLGLLDQQVDYSTPKKLAESLSFPIFANGSKPYPTSFTGGGAIDQVLASEQYYEAKERANRIAVREHSRTPPNPRRNFADCGAFVSTVLVNTIDPEYPGLLVYKQRSYLRNPENGWTKVGSSQSQSPLDLRTGDVFITEADDRTGHTWIWLGNVGGQSDIIADASYGTDESQTAHLPALRKNPLRGKSTDSRGRTYEVWRYTGK